MKHLILIVLAGMAAAMAAQADIIYVQGNVSGVWSADTVMVTGEVRVPPGQTLVIQPGVKVLFQVWCRLIVDSTASLQALGSAADSIYFDAYDQNAHWGGIRFQYSSPASQLLYGRISRGKPTGGDTNGGGIRCFYSSPLIQNCSFSQCSTAYDGKGGAIYCHFSNPLIRSSLIAHCSAIYNGHGGAISCYHSEPTIESNFIQSNSAGTGGYVGTGAGIHCDYSDAIIRDNIIIQNSLYGFAAAIGCDNSNTIICDNLISDNFTTYIDGTGGGILCNNSSPIIYRNTITQNSSASGNAGGIGCVNSNVFISRNIIYDNSANSAGGGLYFYNSTGNINENIIKANAASSGGGVSCASGSMIDLVSNIVCSNSAGSSGGGVFCWGASFAMQENIIYQNIAQLYGGGIKIAGPAIGLIMQSNAINNNHAAGTWSRGGGIHYEQSDDFTAGNSICSNTAVLEGGGVYLAYTTFQYVNDIFWSNESPNGAQLYAIGSSGRIAFSAIQSGWPGLGNIDLYPAFVDTAHDDYRLLWGSPCIDAGHPDSLDPDGTRADMGAFYYNQSVMVRILLTPHATPYLIPETGGTMDYTIRAFNRDSLAHATRIWCDITFPDSSVHGPVLGPVRVMLGAGALLERVRTQNIPAAAPMGVYHYNAYAVVGSDTSSDNFMWGKLGAGNLSARTPSEELGTRNWTNAGEPITDVGGTRSIASASTTPAEYALHPCSPNPFNATTVARFELRDASYVGLKVYDTAGKLVQILVDGWRAAGEHEVTFNAGDLPSGMYFCRIQAGEFEAAQKIILLK